MLQLFLGETMKYIKKLHPPVIALSLLVITIILGEFVPVLDKKIFSSYVYALALFLLSGAIASPAVFSFMKNKTTLNPHGNPKKLVIEGLYKYTRNPMYLSILIFLIGSAFFIGRLAVYFAPVAFWLIMDGVIIPNEEKVLEKTFGKSYLNYKVRVRRWL